MKAETKRGALRFWREWIRPIVIVVVVCSAFRSAVADWHDVPSGSMKPTILEGDRVMVNKLAYGLRVPFTDWRIAEWGGPERGDIVICYSPADGMRLIKRVVAVPGDEISLIANHLAINGAAAGYGPLDDDTIDQIAADERFRHQFVTESVDGRSHAVMLTPANRSIRTFGAVRVPKDMYFVMGDNRDDSKDSRWFGFVPGDLVVAKAWRVAFSLDYDDWYLPRMDRFLHRLP